MTAVFAVGFSWLGLLPLVHDDKLLSAVGIHTHTFVHLHAWFAVFVLLAFAGLARLGLERAKSRKGLEKYFADEKLSPLTAFEVFSSGYMGMIRDIISKEDTRYFFPFIGALFLYIVTCNLMALLPGFQPPTDYINTNVGMAVLVFLLFNIVGLKRDAVGYLRHLGGPVLLLSPFLFLVESISLIVRPVALTIRLTGNIFGDHTVFGIMSGFEIFGLPIPLLPIPFLLLAVLVSTIQAFVFSLLTVIYIGLSVPHADADAH